MHSVWYLGEDMIIPTSRLRTYPIPPCISLIPNNFAFHFIYLDISVSLNYVPFFLNLRISHPVCSLFKKTKQNNSRVVSKYKTDILKVSFQTVFSPSFFSPQYTNTFLKPTFYLYLYYTMVITNLKSSVELLLLP